MDDQQILNPEEIDEQEATRLLAGLASDLSPEGEYRMRRELVAPEQVDVLVAQGREPLELPGSRSMSPPRRRERVGVVVRDSTEAWADRPRPREQQLVDG